MKTLTKNDQKYISVEGEKLINGEMVKCERLLWVGSEKQSAAVEPKPASKRVLARLLASALA